MCAPVTIIAPSDGVTLGSTKGWLQKPLQDHEGVLVEGLAVQQGYAYDQDGKGELLPCTAGGPVKMAREDTPTRRCPRPCPFRRRRRLL